MVGTLRDEEVHRVLAGKVGDALNRCQIGGKVPVQVFGPIGLVDRNPVNHAKCIMERDVKRRGTDQRRQPGHRFCLPFIEGSQNIRQQPKDEVVSQLKRVT